MAYDTKIERIWDSSPFRPLISFENVLNSLIEIKGEMTDFQKKYVEDLLKEIRKYPELIEGIDKVEDLEKYEPVIKVLLSDLFPALLTNNEIKAVTIPFYPKILNLTQRFKKILEDSGSEFEMNFRGLSEHNYYVMNCCVILKQYFKYDIEIKDVPMFIDIPDKTGVVRHYRALFNADFLTILPTENSKILTEEEVAELMDNYENEALWKEKFPEGSWILKGFSILNLYDATIENAVSTLKGNLLADVNEESFKELEKIFQSIYKLPHLKIGFTFFGNFFEQMDFKVIEQKFYSHLLSDSNIQKCETLFCDDVVRKFMTEMEYWAVSDIHRLDSKDPKMKELFDRLRSQNVGSFIFVPLFSNERFMGILELSSPKAGELNSINAHRLDYVLPFIKDKLDNVLAELDNEIEALIQKEYTAIHPSVLWRFKQEAFEFLKNRDKGKEYSLKEIVFQDVYPLYGQIDVQGSTTSRNQAIQKDLILQIETLIDLFEIIFNKAGLPLFEHKIYELKNHLDKLKNTITSNTEQYLQNYIGTEIHPVLNNFRQNTNDLQIKVEIDHYFEKDRTLAGSFFKARREFDESIALINKKLAKILDEKQSEAQTYFPHYYERFKTDGVEHNMYIGSSIAPDKDFNIYYLQNLRLWQMQVMCEMENLFRQLQPNLPNELEVSSLILVFGTPISIRFRMDEKQFDIDGSYNVRYEIAKKRIDKAKIKNSDERITQKGKLTIVYQNSDEEKEYLGYIKLLQHKNLFETEIEKFDVEDLQGIIGLKALRVGFIYNQNLKIYTDYQVINTDPV